MCLLTMLKNSENNGTEEIGLVTPHPGKLSLLPCYEFIPVVITTKLHLPNVDDLCFVLTKISWLQSYLHEDTFSSKACLQNAAIL